MRQVLAVFVLLAGCTEDLRPPAGSSADGPTARRPRSTRELRVAVGAMLSPMATFESYDPLLRDLAAELGRPHQLVQRRTYQEVNQLIVDGEVDLAFVCSGAWVALPADVAEILAVPVLGGASAYHALVVTRADAPFATFADLEHTRFAFTDPLSNTGYYYPLSRVAALGKTPSSFFASTIFSGAHDRSVRAVERGIVDAAAIFDVGVASLWPKLESNRGLRVLERSAPMAPPPVVAPVSVPAPLREAVRDYLLSAAGRPGGRERLATLGVDRFRSPAAVDYTPVRRLMEAAAGGAPR